MERGEDAAWRLRLPVVSFKLVTGMTAVDPVSRVVSATVRVRLKVVNGQCCTDIYFTRAAVPAAKLIQTTQLCSRVGEHQRLTSISSVCGGSPMMVR